MKNRIYNNGGENEEAEKEAKVYIIWTRKRFTWRRTSTRSKRWRGMRTRKKKEEDTKHRVEDEEDEEDEKDEVESDKDYEDQVKRNIKGR